MGKLAIVALGLLALVVGFASLMPDLMGMAADFLTVTQIGEVRQDLREAARDTGSDAGNPSVVAQDDGDELPEPPPMRTARTGDPTAPAGVGFLPDVANAAKAGIDGVSWGYCAWDNGGAVGTITGLLPGISSATHTPAEVNASPSYALIWAGPNRSIDTDCAHAALDDAQGDDIVEMKSVAQGLALATAWRPQGAGTIDFGTGNPQAKVGIGLVPNASDPYQFQVAGPVRLYSTLRIDGASTMAGITGQSLSLSGSLSVGGSTSLAGGLAVTGATTLSGTLSASAAATFASSLSATGLVTAAAGVSAGDVGYGFSSEPGLAIARAAGGGGFSFLVGGSAAAALNASGLSVASQVLLTPDGAGAWWLGSAGSGTLSQRQALAITAAVGTGQISAVRARVAGADRLTLDGSGNYVEGALVSRGGGNTVTLAGAAGALSLLRAGGGAYVDFNDSGSDVTYDARIQQVGSNGLGLLATGGVSVNGSAVWTAGNDGSGSGLDADLIDGHPTALTPASCSDGQVIARVAGVFVCTTVTSSGGGGGVVIAESDPQVGNLMSGRSCRSDGTQVICDLSNQVSGSGTSGQLAAWTASGLANSNDIVINAGEAQFTTGLATPYVYYSSDLRLKDVVGPIPDALGRLRGIGAILYRWKREGGEAPVRMGVSAQDVARHAPWAAAAGPDGFLRVDYGVLNALTIAAVNELSQRVDQMAAALPSADEFPEKPSPASRPEADHETAQDLELRRLAGEVGDLTKRVALLTWISAMAMACGFGSLLLLAFSWPRRRTAAGTAP